MAEPFNVLTLKTIQEGVDASCQSALLDARKVETNFFEERKTKISGLLPSFHPMSATDADWDQVFERRNGICDIGNEIEEEAQEAGRLFPQSNGN